MHKNSGRVLRRLVHDCVSHSNTRETRIVRKRIKSKICLFFVLSSLLPFYKLLLLTWFPAGYHRFCERQALKFNYV